MFKAAEKIGTAVNMEKIVLKGCTAPEGQCRSDNGLNVGKKTLRVELRGAGEEKAMFDPLNGKRQKRSLCVGRQKRERCIKQFIGAAGAVGAGGSPDE